MTLRSQRQGAAGYSLIELMIVLIVLSIGIFAVERLLPTASREQLRDRLRTAGSYYAQEKLEILRTLTLNDANLTDGRHPDDTSTEKVGPKQTHERYWTVSHLPAPLDNVMRVDVVVFWNASHGRDSVATTTYLNQ